MNFSVDLELEGSLKRPYHHRTIQKAFVLAIDWYQNGRELLNYTLTNLVNFKGP